MARTLLTGNILRSGSIPTTALGGGVVTSSLQIIASLPTGSLSSSAQVDYTQLQNIPSGIASSSTQVKNYLPVDTVSSSQQVTAFLPANTVSSSGQVKAFLPTDTVSSSAQVTAFLPTGTVSGSTQIDITNTTNYTTFSSSISVVDTDQMGRLAAIEKVTGSYATTGSNTFVGTQTVSDTTNSTNYLDGAVHIAGGMSVRKDVRVSGSMTVNGLLTAVSMSTLYVTASEYTIGTSKVILNDDDLVRFAGISIVDSGSSSPATASIYWDSMKHKFIYENLNGSSYNSAIFIAGPKNTGSLGDEVGLTSGYLPYATGDDHIDNSVMFQTSSRIGIGTTTPSSLLTVAGVTDLASSAATSKLQILRSGTQARIQNYENGTVSDLLLNWEGGNVGIGTTTPRAIFQVRTQTDGNLGINNSLTGGGVRLQAYNDAGNASSRLEIDGSIIGFNIAASTVMVISGSSGNVGVGTSTPVVKLQVDKSSQVITSTTPSSAVFISNLAAGNAGLELGVDSNAVGYIQNRNITNATYYNLALQPVTGYVGIGTTNPFYKLVVSNGGANGVEIDPENASGTQTAILSYNRSTAAYTPLIIQGLGVTLGHPSYPFTITTSGSVGIGTTIPANKLDVAGTIRASSAETPSAGAGVEISYAPAFSNLGVTGQSQITSYDRTGNSYKGFIYNGSVHEFRLSGGSILVITGSNVGINTTNPGQKLSIEGSGTALENVLRVNNEGNYTTRIWLRNSNHSAYWGLSSTGTADPIATGMAAGAMTLGFGNNFPIQFWNSSPTPSVKMTITSDGTLGIGTTNPTQTLELWTNNVIGLNGIKVNSTGSNANQAGLTLAAGNASTNRASRIDFINNVTSATVPRWTLINDYDQGGTNDFRIVNGSIATVITILQNGNVGIGTNNPLTKLVISSASMAGGIEFTAGSTIVNGGVLQYINRTSETTLPDMNYYLAAAGGGAHKFYTSDTARMIINSSGNVGIGTITPAGKLSIITAASEGSNIPAWDSKYALISPNAGSTSGAALGLGYNTGADRSEIASIAPGIAWKPLHIFTAGITFNAASGNFSATISSSGNVGIGTTNPAVKFHTFGASSSNTLPGNAIGVFESDANAVLSVSVPTANSAALIFPRGSVAYYAGIERDNDKLLLRNNNATQVTIDASGHVLPGANGTQDLGSASFRWATVYTSDLSLSNGIGDWTIVEGEDDLFIYNNKNNKVYKFTLQEVDPSTATPKKS